MTAPKKIYLSDYTPPAYRVNNVYLNICLFDEYATIDSTLDMVREHDGDLVLLGRELELLQIWLNDKQLSDEEYVLDDESLTIKNAPNTAHIRTSVIASSKPSGTTTTEPDVTVLKIRIQLSPIAV